MVSAKLLSKEFSNRKYRALQDVEGFTITVDLDAEKGLPTREGRSNAFRVVVRKATAVNLFALQAYLDGKMTFDNSVLEAISESKPESSRTTLY